MNLEQMTAIIRKIIPEAARTAAETVLVPAIKPAIPIDTGALKASLRVEATPNGCDILTGKSGDSKITGANDTVKYANFQFTRVLRHLLDGKGNPDRMISAVTGIPRGLVNRKRYQFAYRELIKQNALTRKRTDWYGPILADERNINNFQSALVNYINAKL